MIALAGGWVLLLPGLLIFGAAHATAHTSSLYYSLDFDEIIKAAAPAAIGGSRGEGQSTRDIDDEVDEAAKACKAKPDNAEAMKAMPPWLKDKKDKKDGGDSADGEDDEDGKNDEAKKALVNKLEADLELAQ